MANTEQLAPTDVAYGTYDFSDDGKATYLEVDGVSTMDVPEAVPDSTSVNYLKGTVKRASKATPPDIAVGISVFQPQREWYRRWHAAANAGRDLHNRFTTREILEFDGGTGTVEFDADGNATFAVVEEPDLATIVPGYIVRVGTEIRVIEEVDPDNHTMKVSHPTGGTITLAAGTYKVYEPSMRWEWVGKPARPGISGGADAPIASSNLTTVPRDFLRPPAILIPAA